MVSKQPDALRLADSLVLCWGDSRLDEAAAELRRHRQSNRRNEMIDAFFLGMMVGLPRPVLEQALKALNASMPHNNDMDEDWPSHIAARRALRAALEQPQVEQEPVAWVKEGSLPEVTFKMARLWRRQFSEDLIPLYLHPQNLNCKSTQARLATLWGYEKPQPPRQPLTDEEIEEINVSLTGRRDLARMFARAIERAHGIGGEA